MTCTQALFPPGGVFVFLNAGVPLLVNKFQLRPRGSCFDSLVGLRQADYSALVRYIGTFLVRGSSRKTIKGGLLSLAPEIVQV